MYSQIIMENFTNPTHAGKIQHATNVGKAEDGISGDIVKFYLMIENGIVTDATFKALGNAVTIASANILCETVLGKSIIELKQLNKSALMEKIGEFSLDKAYAVDLCVNALHSTLEN